jgi:F-type H+-transporting ATPase subunit delta
VLHRYVHYVSKPAISRPDRARPSRQKSKSRNYKDLAPHRCDAYLVSSRHFKERNVAGENPTVSGVAGRYATALFELARDERSVDVVKADLDRFDAMLAQSPDLTRLVRSPVFSAEEQLKALSAVLDAAGSTGTAAKFLKVLAVNRRLFAVRDVVKAFGVLVANFKGEAAADVTVAEPLSDKNLDALKTALKSVTGQEVSLNVRIDPAIIGGLIVKVGSRMVDSSLRTKLNSIKNAMKEAG